MAEHELRAVEAAQEAEERCPSICPIRKCDTGPYQCELNAGHLGRHQAMELEKYAADFYPTRYWPESERELG